MYMISIILSVDPFPYFFANLQLNYYYYLIKILLACIIRKINFDIKKQYFIIIIGKI